MKLKISLVILFFPILINAQLDSRLIEKSKKIISLVKQGEQERDPHLIIKALKKLLKENRIRSLSRAKEEESFSYQKWDDFSPEGLYNKAKDYIDKPDSKARKKLLRLRGEINRLKSDYKKMDIAGYDGIEVRRYTVNADGEIPIDFKLQRGNRVQFSIEIGRNFSFDILKGKIPVPFTAKQIGNQNLYTLDIKETSEYRVVLRNKLVSLEECILFKHVR